MSLRLWQACATTRLPTLRLAGKNQTTMLSTNEKKLLADALNGCGALIQHDPSYLPLLLSGGLELEVYDACRLNQLDQKWEVDRQALIAKLQAMPVADKERLARTIAGVWERNDERFEADLEACTV